MNNPYEVLGVDRKAPPETIKRAYRTLAKIAHPDAGGSKVEFERLTSAHRLLTDQRRRDHFDRTGQIPPEDDDSRAKQLLFAVLERFIMDDWTANPIVSTAAFLQNEIGQIYSQQNKATNDIVKLEGRIGRIRGGKSKTLIIPMLRSKIAGLEEFLTASGDQVRLRFEAIELLQGIEYDA